LTGTPTCPTAASGTTTSQIANCAWVSTYYAAASSLASYLTTAAAASTYATLSSLAVATSCTTSSSLTSTLASYLTTSTAASTYAPLDSASLTGTPTCPTRPALDSSTKLANCSFVMSALTPYYTGSVIDNKLQSYVTSTSLASTLKWVLEHDRGWFAVRPTGQSHPDRRPEGPNSSGRGLEHEHRDDSVRGH
jgi:hypothetical protein